MSGILTSNNPLPDWNDEFQVMAEKMIMLLSRGFNAVGGGGIPTAGGSSPGFGGGYDEQVFTYYGSTNNINTIVYKLAGATKATLTFSYKGGGATNDDLVTDIKQS